MDPSRGTYNTARSVSGAQFGSDAYRQDSFNAGSASNLGAYQQKYYHDEQIRTSQPTHQVPHQPPAVPRLPQASVQPSGYGNRDNAPTTATAFDIPARPHYPPADHSGSVYAWESSANQDMYPASAYYDHRTGVSTKTFQQTESLPIDVPMMSSAHQQPYQAPSVPYFPQSSYTTPIGQDTSHSNQCHPPMYPPPSPRYSQPTTVRPSPRRHSLTAVRHMSMDTLKSDPRASSGERRWTGQSDFNYAPANPIVPPSSAPHISIPTRPLQQPHHHHIHSSSDHSHGGDIYGPSEPTPRPPFAQQNYPFPNNNYSESSQDEQLYSRGARAAAEYDDYHTPSSSESHVQTQEGHPSDYHSYDEYQRPSSPIGYSPAESMNTSGNYPYPPSHPSSTASSGPRGGSPRKTTKEEPEMVQFGSPAVKPKRRRADAAQLRVLNEVYARTAFPSTEERAQLGQRLNMSPRQVQIWFQNRRQNARGRANSIQQPPATPNPPMGAGPPSVALTAPPSHSSTLPARSTSYPHYGAYPKEEDYGDAF